MFNQTIIRALSTSSTTSTTLAFQLTLDTSTTDTVTNTSMNYSRTGDSWVVRGGGVQTLSENTAFTDNLGLLLRPARTNLADALGVPVTVGDIASNFGWGDTASGDTTAVWRTIPPMTGLPDGYDGPVWQIVDGSWQNLVSASTFTAGQAVAASLCTRVIGREVAGNARLYAGVSGGSADLTSGWSWITIEPYSVVNTSDSTFRMGTRSNASNTIEFIFPETYQLDSFPDYEIIPAGNAVQRTRNTETAKWTMPSRVTSAFGSGGSGSLFLTWIPLVAARTLSTAEGLLTLGNSVDVGLYLDTTAGTIKFSDGTNTATITHSWLSEDVFIIGVDWSAAGGIVLTLYDSEGTLITTNTTAYNGTLTTGSDIELGKDCTIPASYQRLSIYDEVLT